MLGYFKFKLQWIAQTKQLSDAEFGRLVRVMAAYIEGEGNVQEKPSGNEKHVFAVFQQELDQQISLSQRTTKSRSIAGRKGGLSGRKQNKQLLANATNCKQTKQLQANEALYIDDDDDRGSFGVSPEEAAEINEKNAKLLQKAAECGFKPTVWNENEFKRLAAKYGDEAVLKGMEECASHDVLKTEYLESVLRNMDKPREEEDLYGGLEWL